MTEYDQDYYFIRCDEDKGNLPFLTPDTNTRERRYVEKPPIAGTAPLTFYNGFEDEFRADRVKDFAADILFEGSHFVVRDHIRERLLQLDLPDVHLHPAVYIDDRGDWHEDYWFVGVTKEFDCWDHEKSTCGKKKVLIGDEVLHSVYRYVLDAKKLAERPLRKRLLFQMGGTIDGLMTCHKSIASIFRGSGASGAVLQMVTS